MFFKGRGQYQQQQVVVHNNEKKMRICPKCGWQNERDTKFCGDCGFSFKIN